MPKGNKNPVNNILIRATAEMLEFINSLPNPKGLPHFAIVARGFMKCYKKEWIAHFDEDSYENHMRKYNRSPTEMKIERIERDRKAQKERLKREAQIERELTLKEKELDIRADNLEFRKSGEIENEKPVCPECGASGIDIATVQSGYGRPDSYRCRKCRKAFEGSK